MEKNKLLIVADDLTGANDTGILFSKRGFRTIVLTDPERIQDAVEGFDVVVMDTESRNIDAGTAYQKTADVGRIAKELKINTIYKKLDSTLRGNIGAEVTALMDTLGINHSILVPALPGEGRTTVEGTMYVYGKLLEYTEYAGDPGSPFNTSSISEIFSLQSERTIAVVPLGDVRSGKGRLENVIQTHFKKDVHVIVIDVEDEKDLGRIALSVTGLNEKVLLAGSSGLAAHLPDTPHDPSGRTNVVIAGSLSAVTRMQVEYAGSDPAVRIIDVRIGQILSGRQLPELNRILSEVNSGVEEAEDVIICTARSPESVAKGFETGRTQGLDRSSVSDVVAGFLGELTKHIADRFRVNGLLLTGGDIAIRAVEQLGGSGIVLEEEVLPGVPCGRLSMEALRDLCIVTKAGGFGREDTILKVLKALRARVSS